MREKKAHFAENTNFHFMITKRCKRKHTHALWRGWHGGSAVSALYKNRELFVFHLREQGKRNTHTREDEDERKACMCMCYHFHVWIVEYRIHIAAQHGREIDLIVAKHLISIRIRPHTQSLCIISVATTPHQNKTDGRKKQKSSTQRLCELVVLCCRCLTHTHTSRTSTPNEQTNEVNSHSERQHAVIFVHNLQQRESQLHNRGRLRQR